MQRYFINQCVDRVIFDKKSEIYYHLTKVLRVAISTKVEFCDNYQKCYVYSIVEIDKEKIVFEKTETQIKYTKKDKRIILAVSLLKNNNFELVIQKAVELGVDVIIPFISKRTIVKIDSIKDEKLKRYNKIALEAAEQSKRFTVPIIFNVIDFRDLVQIDYTNGFVAYEKSDLSNHLMECEFGSVNLLIIGPEGGFGDDEIKFLHHNGIQVINLGNTILRAETAAISAVALANACIETREDNKYGKY